MTLDNARLARENLRISLTNERNLMATRSTIRWPGDLHADADEPAARRDPGGGRAARAQFWGDVDDTLGTRTAGCASSSPIFAAGWIRRGCMRCPRSATSFSTGPGSRSSSSTAFRPVTFARPRARGLPHRPGSVANVCRHAQGEARDGRPRARHDATANWSWSRTRRRHGGVSGGGRQDGRGITASRMQERARA